MIKISKKYWKMKEESKGSSGFLGISIGKKIFYDKEIMEDYIKFVNEHFSDFFFLVADLPKRFNIMALEGITEEKARDRVEIAGEETRKFLANLIKDYSKIKVIRYSELCGSNYKHNLKILHEAYERDIEFRKAFDEEVLSFLSIENNQERLRVNKIGLKKALAMSVNYKLDELAILLAIPCEFDSICEIYPGVDELHEDLQDSKFDFCSKLKLNPKRMFMEVYNEN